MKGKRFTEEPFKLFSNLITGAVLREQVTPHKTPFPNPPHTHPLSSAIPPKLSVSPR